MKYHIRVDSTKTLGRWSYIDLPSDDLDAVMSGPAAAALKAHVRDYHCGPQAALVQEKTERYSAAVADDVLKVSYWFTDRHFRVHSGTVTLIREAA